MSSSEIYSQIKKYENIRATISGLYGKFNSCIGISLQALNIDSNELIVGGKSILEKEYTIKGVNRELNYSISLLNAIISECNKEISELWVAYYDAIVKEKESNGKKKWWQL